MNPDPRPEDPPIHEPEPRASYSLEITAEIAGVSSQTILRYQEYGLIQPAPDSGKFDDEAVRTLRRIEHLRQTSEANLAGIKLILDLLDQVETLRTALRERR